MTGWRKTLRLIVLPVFALVVVPASAHQNGAARGNDVGAIPAPPPAPSRPSPSLAVPPPQPPPVSNAAPTRSAPPPNIFSPVSPRPLTPARPSAVTPHAVPPVALPAPRVSPQNPAPAFKPYVPHDWTRDSASGHQRLYSGSSHKPYELYGNAPVQIFEDLSRHYGDCDYIRRKAGRHGWIKSHSAYRDCFEN